MNELKNSFIRNKIHPEKGVYKCLGDDYVHPIKVRLENFGLATNLYVDIFANKFQQKKHNTIKQTISLESSRVLSNTSYDRCWSNYSINNLAVLANQLGGFGPADFKKYFSFLNFRTESFQKLHYYCEDNVGKILQNLAKVSMTRKLNLERRLSNKFF